MNGDIEDIIVDNDEISEETVPSILLNHSKKGSIAFNSNVDDVPFVHGMIKLWIMTFGCAHNFADGEFMKGLLVNYGYEFVDAREEADLWILNSCTVKDPSEDAFHNFVIEGKKLGKKLVLAGCVPQADSDALWIQDLSILGVKQIHRIVEVVNDTLNGRKIQLLSLKGIPTLNIPKVRRDPYIDIIPISEGCLGHCTYCKTRFARGKLMSYSIDDICNRITSAVNDKVYEIWLSSEDTGAYGLDIGNNMGHLLTAVTAAIPTGSNAMIRLGMGNPTFMYQHLNELIDFFSHPNVFAFLHIPIQSGSDRVLESMQREYEVKHFQTIVDTLLAAVPGLTIATDIIVGFPSESVDDHMLTMQLLQKYDFAIVNISKYYPRPGTPAAEMPRIQSTEVKRRSVQLSKYFKELDPYSGFIDKYELVWVGSERSGDQMVAHTKAYVKVLIPMEDGLQGTRIVVKIVKLSRFHIVGSIVDRHPAGIYGMLSPTALEKKINESYGKSN